MTTLYIINVTNIFYTFKWLAKKKKKSGLVFSPKIKYKHAKIKFDR